VTAPLQVTPLHLGTVDLPAAFKAEGHSGEPEPTPVYGFLITGAGDPVLVDTGYRDEDTLARAGLRARPSPDGSLLGQLADRGIALSDVRYVVHTHLHLDHAGADDQFPPTTTVVAHRAELGFAVSGAQTHLYPLADVRHLVERLHTPGGLLLLGPDQSGPVELAEGIVCEHAGGHTPGSLNVRVVTARGIATLCGDLVYSVEHQLRAPARSGHPREPGLTGNYALSRDEERTALWRLLQGTDVLLSSHDDPVLVSAGRVGASLPAQAI
jgi:glyoxylase-like metal-dependent hydrolase (beta-lactamase superfamily II)